uniref:(California timema) hypothetical protein n=1 Tax=Timema californicum TaxID=61474 RepID=A0A7R9IZI0_TIMCA|nr:unnamed protein product [Timema californicum]
MVVYVKQPCCVGTEVGRAMVGFVAAEEYRKNPKLRLEDIQYLQDWLSKEQYLPTVSEELLILFLHASYYKLEAAKTFIDHYYTIKTHAPILFTRRDPLLQELQDYFSVIQVVILPEKDSQGNVVVIARLKQEDPTVYSHPLSIKTYIMVQDMAVLEHGTVPGFVHILDFKGLTFRHLANINLTIIKQYFTYIQVKEGFGNQINLCLDQGLNPGPPAQKSDTLPLDRQEGYPGIISKDHVIHVVSVTEKILAMCKPFMKKELLAKLQVHSGDMESFYKMVPKKILPKDYGGDGETMEELQRRTCEKMLEHREWFIQDEKMRVDESKRPGKAKSAGDVFGLEGSFKKLDID